MKPDEHGAIFSPDRTRRFHLWRVWDSSLLTAVFIGKNPSTADEMQDDPTIRRCIGFAQSWGRGGVQMVNLFPTVSTNPAGVVPRLDAENMAVLEKVITSPTTGIVVAAWGVLPKAWDEVGVLSLLRAKGIGLWCLGKNRDGSPQHPLYIPSDMKPKIYTPGRPYESDGWDRMVYRGWD